MDERRAIGLIETSSIARGFLIADAVIKAADVEIIVNRTICPGKYMVLIGGRVDAVQTSVDAGVRGRRTQRGRSLRHPQRASGRLSGHQRSQSPAGHSRRWGSSRPSAWPRSSKRPTPR